jgi:hypothetical protein
MELVSYLNLNLNRKSDLIPETEEIRNKIKHSHLVQRCIYYEPLGAEVAQSV